MIRNTTHRASRRALVGLRDNAAVIEGGDGARFFPDAADGVYAAQEPRTS